MASGQQRYLPPKNRLSKGLSHCKVAQMLATSYFLVGTCCYKAIPSCLFAASNRPPIVVAQDGSLLQLNFQERVIKAASTVGNPPWTFDSEFFRPATTAACHTPLCPVQTMNPTTPPHPSATPPRGEYRRWLVISEKSRETRRPLVEVSPFRMDMKSIYAL